MLKLNYPWKALVSLGSCAVLMLSTAIPARAGELIGLTVVERGSLQDTIAGAAVRLDYLDSDIGSHWDTLSAENGRFSFVDLPSGVYSVTAGSVGLGFATEVVEVDPRIPTHITLGLTGGVGIGEYEGVHTVRGVARVVINPISRLPEYFLDVGGDSTLDYRLLFGAWWYTPPGDTISRPGSGSVVFITGSPFGYSAPPILIVRQLNAHQWRGPQDHGGVSGDYYYALGCTTTTVIRIETYGNVEMQADSIAPEDTTQYLIHGEYDSLNAFLDFGELTYNPNTGAMRPTDREHVHIVGGLVNCGDSQYSRIIVYEIDGLLWRLPGDTTGFGNLPVDIHRNNKYPDHIASDHILISNYPNPFNATTTIIYSVPVSGLIHVKVFDLLGRHVATPLVSYQPAGRHSLNWNGNELPSGIYLCEISSQSLRSVHRMVLLK